MHLDDYSRYDAVGLAELVRRKEVTPEELVRTAAAAIARVNPRLNAVIDVREAEALDAVKRGLPEGPFHGVPFLIKDLVLHAASVPTDLGSRLGQGLVFPHDSALMARFKRAGLVLLGRTNTPEFGNNATTEPVLHGPTRNPWNLEHSPGGSSGGSAAAVAAGIVPVAHANDGGGSIRIPASLCGLFGMKPTRGRISLGPDVGEALNGMAGEHVVSRTVRDSAAMLDATCEPEVGDPYYPPPPQRPFLEEVRRKPGRLRIALARTAAGGEPVSPDCVAAVEDAAKLCRELGHEVVEANIAYDARALNAAMTKVWAAALANWADGLSAMLGRTAGPETLEATSLAAVQLGRDLKVSELQAALAVFNQVSRSVGAFFVEHDVLLTPTVAVPPYKLGLMDATVPRAPEDWYAYVFGFCPYTAVFNVTGQPAMSVPLSWNAQGLPIGVQFAGRFADEATLFRLAGQLEEARPWAGRRPPVHVTQAA
ncbi:amidase [Pyxidicoccus fallax]|uniref:Amidase n=1 Tax=Pyxidicoccus fallax TaxID=394095 RepID=A0A848LC90_9BACT|nr:amidase [Pyxidicoccus fallax]NMO14343.1 amidase [Pyxidicoccus fallax]NPC77132.1 amidase [Pyxidicoccus fallax]